MLKRLQQALLFAGSTRVPACRPWRDIPGLERWWAQTEEGPLESWWLPALAGEGARPAIFFAHGNGELIDDWPVSMAAFRARGFHVVLAEYRGYGRSEGHGSEAKVRADFVRLWDRVMARDDVDAEYSVAMGRSLGGAAVAQLIRERMPRALVLMSTFTNTAAMARHLYRAPSFFISERFDTAAILRQHAPPTLHLHGTLDELVPFAHAEELAAITGGRLLRESSGHSDCPLDWTAFVDACVAFFTENGVPVHPNSDARPGGSG